MMRRGRGAAGCNEGLCCCVNERADRKTAAPESIVFLVVEISPTRVLATAVNVGDEMGSWPTAGESLSSDNSSSVGVDEIMSCIEI